MMAEPKHIDLYEFLVESELQHYYNSIKTELKITNVVHLKYASDEDLKLIGLSRPEIRRLRKFYDKYYPHGYLSKFKRLLQNPRRDEGAIPNQVASASEPIKATSSPSKVPSNKHIIPAESICINKQLGTGEFGIVQQGVWTNGTERIQVAIKCLSRERMQSNPMEFLKEAGIMHSIDHENIVRLYGVVLGTESLMLVTELAHLRSLLECLKDSGLRVNFLTVPTLCEFAMQICNGMMYLENKRLIHRDLAARNILVFSKNKVKISDFGLSRALGVGKDYYKTNFNVNLKLPIAWCAPECINYLRFTNSSDVWAYGVCLWEMFSYGFQPWAALTGLQILEAIDEPNYQRLEQPECCPREYYSLMLKCWAHDPAKRPKFSDIYAILPDMKPEQLKTIGSNCDPKKDLLLYRQGEIVTVLDKCTNSQYWKGILNSGKTGLFDPGNTVAYVEGLPTSNNRDSFCRTSDRQSKRKLRTEMISMPQNDLKHTGHVGLDGAFFGDVAFIASSQNYNQLPRQIVTPYKPSEDIEQTPLLLPPTPTSPDSLQTASGYFPEATSSTNPSFVNSNENTPKHNSNAFGTSFDFPPKAVFSSSNPFASSANATADASSTLALQNNNYGLEANAFTNANLEDDSVHDPTSSAASKNVKWMESDSDAQHEYHEISDDEITIGTGPSLLDEINSLFGSMSTATTTTLVTGSVDTGPKSPDFDHTNKKNEITELASKLNRKNSGGDTNGNKSKKRTTGTVKPISVKDEKILNQAIEIATEISTRSMNDLVSQDTPSAQSPRRKFSFRFPNLTHHSLDKDGMGVASGSHYNGNSGTMMHGKERKNFSDELKNIPDLQNSITEEHKEAYNSLIERKPSLTSSLIGKFEGHEFQLASAKTLPKKFSIGGSKGSRFSDSKNCREADLTVPSQQAPRPTTLPHRLRTQKFEMGNGDHNPLRILKHSGQPTLTRQRAISTDDEENANAHKPTAMDGSDKDSNCESPSYLTNTSYTFPEKQNCIPATHNNNGTLSTNLIPLPPRDRNKPMPTNVKRHVRKHPLIIPGAGLQRTLNKVRDTTPVEDEPKVGFPTVQIDRNLNHVGRSNFNNESDKMAGILDRPSRVNSTDDNTNSLISGSKNCNSLEESALGRTYQNIDKLNSSMDNTDCASLHFETILEDNFFKTDNLSSPDVVDGFCPFSIQKDLYNKSTDIDFDSPNLSDSSKK